jgi:hypothetical protein
VAIEPTSGAAAAGPPGTSLPPLARDSGRDRALSERLELIALHAAVMRTHMQEAAQTLHVALARDLIGADDFAGYNRDRLAAKLR